MLFVRARCLLCFQYRGIIVLRPCLATLYKETSKSNLSSCKHSETNPCHSLAGDKAYIHCRVENLDLPVLFLPVTLHYLLFLILEAKNEGVNWHMKVETDRSSTCVLVSYQPGRVEYVKEMLDANQTAHLAEDTKPARSKKLTASFFSLFKQVCCQVL